MNTRDTQILRIALPSIVSNITVPLLGMIDVAIVGHMDSPVYIGAVAVGSMIFNLIYWVFAFLRMGSSGLTSQALGRRDLAEVTRLLVRSMTIALGIAALLLTFQMPLKWLMFSIISPTADVAPLASAYFDIVVWGAPAVLGLYSLSGWYVGMQDTRTPMLVSIGQNVVNVLASLTLVYGLGMKTEGVALGTVIAQYSGFLMALGMLLCRYGRLRRYLVLRGTFVRRAMKPFFNVNRDIFLRTLCLVSVNLYFTSAGARHGAVILSVNTIMMQFFLFYSYFMDGFAYAGEALGGRAYGARNAEAFWSILRRLAGWAAAVTLLFTFVYVVFGLRMIGLLTDEPHVTQTAREYVGWIWLVPLASTMAFILDGIFIGITATRVMLLSSFLATLLFFAVYLLTRGLWDNHALWLAMIVYLVMRGAVQAVWLKKHSCTDALLR